MNGSVNTPIKLHADVRSMASDLLPWASLCLLFYLLLSKVFTKKKKLIKKIYIFIYIFFFYAVRTTHDVTVVGVFKKTVRASINSGGMFPITPSFAVRRPSHGLINKMKTNP